MVHSFQSPRFALRPSCNTRCPVGTGYPLTTHASLLALHRQHVRPATYVCPLHFPQVRVGSVCSTCWSIDSASTQSRTSSLVASSTKCCVGSGKSLGMSVSSKSTLSSSDSSPPSSISSVMSRYRLRKTNASDSSFASRHAMPASKKALSAGTRPQNLSSDVAALALSTGMSASLHLARTSAKLVASRHRLRSARCSALISGVADMVSTSDVKNFLSPSSPTPSCAPPSTSPAISLYSAKYLGSAGAPLSASMSAAASGLPPLSSMVACLMEYDAATSGPKARASSCATSQSPRLAASSAAAGDASLFSLSPRLSLAASLNPTMSRLG
mmetsp:Transcript_1848/g.7724  ORF Transcript_1848/g.7724 Transcript_1848/m.7724 type:complete len:328 (+) Transcript_1848:96-1079(+)